MQHDIGDFYHAHKKRLFLYGSLLLIILLTIILLSQFRLQQTFRQPVPSTSPTSYPAVPTQGQSKVLDIPKVNFASYSIQAAYPLVPDSVTTYTLKTNFTPDEIRTFAQKIGMNDIKESKTDYVTLSNLADKNKGFGLLNKNSGSFNLQMYGDQRPTGYIAGMSPQQEALVYLQELGITDETVTCPITYQRIPFTGQNGYTYVECHRDWQKLSLPVYSLIGLLNTPANIPLNSLIVGKVRPNSPLDNTVTNVSTGQDGYARPNDFNTATVGIKNDGAIESIVSSFKWIQTKQTVLKKDILTPQEALDLFKSHKALLSLTIPDGTGSVNWEKVYQNNEARQLLRT